jgi:hypothetical protein
MSERCGSPHPDVDGVFCIRKDDGTSHEKHMGLNALDKLQWVNNEYVPYVPPPVEVKKTIAEEIKTARDIAGLAGLIPQEEKRAVFVEPTLAEQAVANVVGRYHENDPETSRIAAEGVAIRTGTHKARILCELDRQDDYGATPDELWKTTGGAFPHVSATRCADLRDLGLVEMTETTRTTDRGFPSFVWRITDAGRLVARSLAL